MKIFIRMTPVEIQIPDEIGIVNCRMLDTQGKRI